MLMVGLGICSAERWVVYPTVLRSGGFEDYVQGTDDPQAKTKESQVPEPERRSEGREVPPGPAGVQ